MIRALIIGSALWIATASAAQRRPSPPVFVPPPIVRAPSFKSESYGDWNVELIARRFYFASVSNSAGSIFGAYCSDKGCVSFVSSASTCDDGSKYPLLVNSPDEAFSVVSLCRHVGKAQLLTWEDTGEMVSALSIGGMIGIATPMASGDFKVSRWSLTGGARAYARAAQLAKAAPATRTEGSDERRL